MNSIFTLFLLLLSSLKANDSVLSNEFTTNHFTDNDFSSWTRIGNNLPLTHLFTQCGSQRIFGGYQKFGGDQTLPIKISRQYTGLIAHYAIRVQAKIYKIDSWSNQSLFVMVDNRAQKIYTFNQNSTGSEICGDPFPPIDTINTNFNDSIFTVDLTVNHTRSVLDLGFETSLNSDRGWWGLRQLRVTILLCDKSCRTCTNSSSCTSCDGASIAGLTLIGAYCECPSGQIKQLTTHCTIMPCIMCLPGCSPGYFNSAVTGKCQSCHPACPTCSSGANTLSPACGPSCSLGYFRNDPLNQPCYNCLGGCSACNALTTTDCTACKQGYFYFGGRCLISCPDGMYSEQNLKSCFACPPASLCLTCDGGTSSHCKSCSGIYFLTPNHKCEASCPLPYLKYNNKCYQECPQGTFQDYTIYACFPCSTNCYECPNALSCSKCADGYYLMNGVCQGSCPNTHYPSQNLGECLICNPDCLQCFGPSSTSCKVCSDASKILLNGSCYSSCPNGTYSAFCLRCHSSCLQCTGPLETDCLNCPSPKFLDLQSNKCLDTCEPGTIVEKVNFTCRWCPKSMVGYFHQCVACSSTCHNCFGTSFLECSNCKSDWELYRSTCVKRTNSGFFIIKSDAKSFTTKTAFSYLLIVLLTICVILQIFFTYKTPLLPTLQFIQVLSYFLYLSIPMSEKVQQILQFFSYSVFTSHINLSFQVIAQNLPLKISIMGKTGFYAIDTFGIHIVIILTLFLMVLVRKIRSLSKVLDLVHEKINPYLASYLYRMIILDQFFSLMIYLRYGGIRNSVGIVSMVVLVVDVLLLGLTLFWKIMPVNEQKKEYALFYFNQIKQQYEMESNQYQTKLKQPNQAARNENKLSILSLFFYIGKVPFPLAIVYFIDNGFYQAVAICGYSAFFLLMLIILPFKRKIYRFLYFFGAFILLVSTVFFIAMDSSQKYSIALQAVWLIYICLSLIITFVQLLINYKLFISIFKYTRYHLQNLFSQQQNEQKSSHVSQIDLSQQKMTCQPNFESQNLNKNSQCENPSAQKKNKKHLTNIQLVQEKQQKQNWKVWDGLSIKQKATDILDKKENQKQKSRNIQKTVIQKNLSRGQQYEVASVVRDAQSHNQQDVDLDFDL